MHEGSIPLYWRLKKSRYNLVGSRCASCKRLFYPQRSVCPDCRRKGRLEDFQFSGSGKIISYTIIRSAPNGFEKYAPYPVAIIRLEEGAEITGQVCAEPNDMQTGKSVRPVFRKIYDNNNGGIIHYGLKFELAEENGA